MHDWRKPQPTRDDFVVWAAIILVGLALLSLASGVAPLTEPGLSGAP